MSNNTYAALWRLSWPNFVSSSLMPLSSVLTMVLIGRVSATALAVVGLALAILFPLNTALARLIRSTTAVFSELNATNNVSELVRFFWQVLWVGLFASVLLIVFFLLVPFSFPAFGLSGTLEGITRWYLYLATLGLPAMALILVFMTFLFGQGIVKPVMNVTLVGVFLSPPLTFFFAAWNFGRPLGAVGFCISTVIIQWLSVVLLLFPIIKRSRETHLSLFANAAGPDISAMNSIWKIGIPLAGSSLIRLSGGAVVALFAARSGTVQMAAYQIATSLADALMLPVSSLAMSLIVILGEEVASQNRNKMRRTLFAVILVSFLVTLFVSSAMLSLRPWIVTCYSGSNLVQRAAGPALIAVAFYLFVQMLVVLCESVLTVYKKTQRIPLAVFLSYFVIVVLMAIHATVTVNIPAYFFRMCIFFASALSALALGVITTKTVLPKMRDYVEISESQMEAS